MAAESATGAYCDDWIGDGDRYCYLAHGEYAASCPGAQESTKQDKLYYTLDATICAGEDNPSFLVVTLNRTSG